MSNYYSIATACDAIPGTADDFEHLLGLLTVDPMEGDPSEFQIHGFELEYFGTDTTKPGSIYLKAPESCDVDAIPKKFCKALGKLLKKSKLKFLQIGVAMTCDRLRPDSHGGYYVRILPDGRLVSPKLVWPK